MKTLFRFLIIFLCLTGFATLVLQYTDFTFGEVDFFAKHGYWFLILIALFPRLTLLFSSVPFGGLLWWLSFIFVPRYLVATLATMAYWKTNPYLVTISWLVAVGGETTEKYVVAKKRRNVIDVKATRVES